MQLVRDALRSFGISAHFLYAGHPTDVGEGFVLSFLPRHTQNIFTIMFHSKKVYF